MNTRAAVLVLLAGAALGVPDPARGEEHVTAPSLPSQPNKDTSVVPGSGLRTTRDGLVYQGPDRPVRVVTERSTRESSAPADVAFPAIAPPPKSAPGPLGAPVVAAAFVTRRGMVAKLEKGKSITILEKNGKERLVPLAPGAAVYADIQIGDAVVLRIPFDEGADGKTADRVEKSKPASELSSPSKFSQAQVKGN